MSFRAFILWLIAPAVALAQVQHFAPGERIRISGPDVRLSAPAYDADAIAYFLRSGVTDATAKRQISNFVRDVKALGLWTSIVCWPLQSAKNAGSGTIAYSLGGLGAYNGTLVNGPTWSAGGIVQVGVTEGITITGLPTNLPTISMGVRFNPGTVTSNRDFLQLNGVKISTTTAPTVHLSCSGVGTLSPAATTLANSTTVSLSASISPSGGNSTYSGVSYKDGVFLNTSTRAASNPTSYFSIGNGDNLTRAHPGTYAFAWMYSGSLNASQHASLYALIVTLTQ